MASPDRTTKHSKRRKIQNSDLKNLKYFRQLLPLLERLHEDATARDKAGNRELFYDGYVCLLLLAFFNPIITSLRALEEAPELEKVQKLFGLKGTALASLSEAGSLFNPDLLRTVVQQLGQQAASLEANLGGLCAAKKRDLEALRGLTAVDGTFIRALPRMFWSLCRKSNYAAKMHLQFSVLAGVPLDATLTTGTSSERHELSQVLQSGFIYVTDRGYASFTLCRRILDHGSSFIGRVQENVAYVIERERPLPKEALDANIIHDYDVSKLGASHHKDEIGQTVRLVVVQFTKGDGSVTTLNLVTDRLDLPAETIALGYRYRWSVELYFRWFKRVLGCRHLFSENLNGMAIQCYTALIASLMVVIYTGIKLNKRTWEMVQYYFMGWATLDEFERHINKVRAAEALKAAKAA